MVNVSLYIARRYFSKRKKKNIINWIVSISVVGITIITASLVILLSAFNGIEAMIEKLYSDFDPSITIRHKEAKTFVRNDLNLITLESQVGKLNYSWAIEETVVLKREKKWKNATVYGVDPSFIEMSNMSQHLIGVNPEDMPRFSAKSAFIGADLVIDLDAYVDPGNMDHLLIYAPRRNAKMRLGSNPFNTQMINVAGQINFNKETNKEAIVLPIDEVANLLEYGNEVSALYLKTKPGNEEMIKDRLCKILNKNFWTIKTNKEKNDLIFKTSKTEKLIVLAILVFVFILAAFNLIASITMLFVEKFENVKTMIGFGANRKSIFKIFFFEGLLISGKGVFFGLLLGYLVCIIQYCWHPLLMPNSFGEPFPIRMSLIDGVVIIVLVGLLSVIFAYLPARYLIRKNLGEMQF